jgi:hypothetical protein
MRSMKWAASIVFALVLLAAGCRGGVPVYNVTDTQVVASKPNPSLDEVGKAIQRAGAALGWNLKPTKPGHMIGTLNIRKHVAVVDVNYSVKSFSIQYKDSTELGYDGSSIHPNYNGWIQNLDKGIRAQLSNL